MLKHPQTTTNNMKYNIQLPFFPGFYESLIDPRYLQDNYFDDYESKKQYIEKYGIDFFS